MADEASNPEETNASGRAARVSEDGVVFLHRNDVVIAAPGHEAQAEQLIEDAHTAIHYYFPVEIEVRNTGSDVDQEALITATLRRLAQGVENV
jgi:hypothetical protein